MRGAVGLGGLDTVMGEEPKKESPSSSEKRPEDFCRGAAVFAEVFCVAEDLEEELEEDLEEELEEERGSFAAD